MDFSEAASHARKMKRSFDAFSKLEEVLLEATRAESTAGEVCDVKRVLDAEVVSLSEKVRALREQGKALDADLLTREAEVAACKQGAAAEMDAFLASQEAKRVAVVKGIDLSLVGVRDAAEKARQGYAAKTRAAKAKSDEAEDKLAALQKLVGTLQQKIEGLS